MGWGTDFVAKVYLSHLTFENTDEVQEQLDLNITEIQDAKQKIKMFASSTPNDIIPDDWKDEPIDWLNNSLNELFETINELTEENVRLNQYIEYLGDDGMNKIFIDWNILNSFFMKTTATAYKCGLTKTSLDEELPVASNKKELEELIKKYSIDN